MTTTGATTAIDASGATTAYAKIAQRAPLDEAMIAMDVADTLRAGALHVDTSTQDRSIRDRARNDDASDSELIEHLREIYRSQGIDVSEKALAEGVRTFRQDRFAYRPPDDGWGIRLANLYVTRAIWGRYAIGALGAVTALWMAWYALFESPRQSRRLAERIELAETIPTRLAVLQEQITAEIRQSRQTALQSGVATAVRRGLAAARTGHLAGARVARDDLERQLGRLRAEYTIRIASRQGELTGLWRIPKANRQARNYYLVVEAIDKRGTVVAQTVLNEETGKREAVTTWAVPVPRQVLERLRGNKADDPIMGNGKVGEKRRGFLEPDWHIPVGGAAITRW